MWNNEFKFNIHSFRTEDWYGLSGHKTRMINCSEEEVKKYQNNWNPHLRNLIHPGDVVLDCGANEGHVAICMALRAGPLGRVIAIEGSSYTADLMLHNVVLNGLDDRIKVEVKLIDAVGGSQAYSFGEVYYKTPIHQDSLAAPTTCLNEYVEYKPNVVKIDIEGYEVEALRGAKELLKLKPRIELEVHMSDGTGIDFRKWGYTTEELYDILASQGYKIYRPVSNEGLSPVTNYKQVYNGVLIAM